MTREEVKAFLTDISYDLGTVGMEYLSVKDGEKMREAIETLEQEPKTGYWKYDYTSAKDGVLEIRLYKCRWT